MTDIFNNIISGIIGGLAVLVVQKILDIIEKIRNEKKGLLIAPIKHKKILPSNIFEFLKPNTSLKKADELFGYADSLFTYVDYHSADKSFQPMIYFYKFRNAYLKLSSLNNISIDSVTVFYINGSKPKIKIPQYHAGVLADSNLGKAKVTKELIEADAFVDLSTMSQKLIAIKKYYGRPGRYFHYTYFSLDSNQSFEYSNSNNPTALLDAEITGIGLSNSDFCPPISLEEMHY